jgi:hypothetical protein
LFDVVEVKMRRGQIGFEYLILMGFVTLVVAGVLGIAFFYSSSVDEQVGMSQIENFANKIISTAEDISYAGDPSRVTIDVYLPDSVENIQIADNSLFITVRGSGAIIGFPARANITGAITSTPGTKRIKIRAYENNVTISQS